MVCVTEWERKTHKPAGEEQKKQALMKKKAEVQIQKIQNTKENHKS